MYTILCRGNPLIARTKEERGNLGPVFQLFQLGLELVAVHSLSEITGRFCLFLTLLLKEFSAFY